MSKTILVTGCCGFIGSNMCNFLLKKNYKVFGIDNLLTGRLSNIEKTLLDKNFTFLKHDICLNISIKEDIDYVLHFASPASPKDYLKYPIETLKAGSRGTENVLELGLKKKQKYLLPQHLKYMVIHFNIHKKKVILEMLIP